MRAESHHVRTRNDQHEIAVKLTWDSIICDTKIDQIQRDKTLQWVERCSGYL